MRRSSTSRERSCWSRASSRAPKRPSRPVSRSRPTSPNTWPIWRWRSIKRAKDLVNKSLQSEKLAIAYSLKGTILLDEGLLNLVEAEFNKALQLTPGNKTALKKLEIIKRRREEEKKGFFQKMFK